MNCQTMDQLWDRMRDGINAPQALNQPEQTAQTDGTDPQITPDQHQAFELHLESCPRCQNLWQAEADWLHMVAQPDLDAQTADSAAPFADRVMASWQQSQRGPLFKIGPNIRVAVQVGLAVAAVCALMISAWFIFVRPVEVPIGPDPVVVDVKSGSFTPSIKNPNTASISPVASLVGAVGQYTDGPAMIHDGIESTRLAFSFDRALAMLSEEISVPDPAQYVQP